MNHVISKKTVNDLRVPNLQEMFMLFNTKQKTVEPHTHTDMRTHSLGKEESNPPSSTCNTVQPGSHKTYAPTHVCETHGTKIIQPARTQIKLKTNF